MRHTKKPLVRATYLISLLAIHIAIGLSGCFSMGMPEIVNSPPPSPQRPRMVALVAPSEVLSFHSAPELLGVQYVAALFPVSRLTLAHGSGLFLAEAAAEVLQLAGYDPVIVSENSLPRASSALSLIHVLRPQLQDLAVNAYDALFFRILRISGEIKLDELRADNGQLRRSRALPIDETQYRSDGHAPTLSSLLKRALSQTLKQGIQNLASPLRAPTNRSAQLEQSPMITLKLLSGTAALRPSAAQIEASYGFPGALGYNERSIARLIQRGMHASLEERSISSLGVSLDSSTPLFPRQAIWVVTGVIEELAIGEKLSLGVKLQLEEVRPGGSSSVLLRAHCGGSFEELDTLDGSWAFTLERASGQLLISFLEQGEECSAIS